MIYVMIGLQNFSLIYHISHINPKNPSACGMGFVFFQIHLVIFNHQKELAYIVSFPKRSFADSTLERRPISTRPVAEDFLGRSVVVQIVLEIDPCSIIPYPIFANYPNQKIDVEQWRGMQNLIDLTIDFVGFKKDTLFSMWQWINKPPAHTHSVADCVGNDKGWITKDELRKEPLLEWGCLHDNQSVTPLTTTMTIHAPKPLRRVPPWIRALNGTNLELWPHVF